EQVRGEKVDGLSDLFSVGCMLYELLTGRRPFDGENVMATLYQIANGTVEVDLPPGPAFAPLLPVVRRATARKPENRFATAGEFAAALRACLEPRSGTRAEAAAPLGFSDGEARGRTTAALPASPVGAPAGPTTRRMHVGRL